MSEGVVKLLRLLFRNHFLPFEGISPEDGEQVLPSYFFSWLETQFDLERLVTDTALASGVKADAVDHVLVRLVPNSGRVEAIAMVWPMIVGRDRESKHTLQSFTLSLVLNYADGTSSAMDSCSSSVADGASFSEDLVAAIMLENVESFIKLLRNYGLDGLYTRGANCDAYEVLMGVLLKAHQQLKPEFQQRFLNLTRLVQRLVRPGLPAKMQEAFKAAGQKVGRFENLGIEGYQPPGAGGWDVG